MMPNCETSRKKCYWWRLFVVDEATHPSWACSVIPMEWKTTLCLSDRHAVSHSDRQTVSIHDVFMVPLSIHPSDRSRFTAGTVSPLSGPQRTHWLPLEWGGPRLFPDSVFFTLRLFFFFSFKPDQLKTSITLTLSQTSSAAWVPSRLHLIPYRATLIPSRLREILVSIKHLLATQWYVVLIRGSNNNDCWFLFLVFSFF